MNRKPIKKETEKQSEQAVSTCAAPASDGCVAPAAAAGPALVKAIAFPVLLFLAMTVQTGTVSMLLCALAFLSLLGKKPLLRFRQRLCVPVLGLLAFAILYGAAAIYTPFGASGLKEFYKFLAAFSLAVILLARYDREDVPGLLWGFAAISAIIGIISVDAASYGPLFSAFNWMANLFGADFSTILETESLTRINGIYNDANVSGCIFGLGTLVALHLTERPGRTWAVRFAACSLLGANAMAFFLSLSRGAILFFAVACLFWLGTVGKGKRLTLFLRMMAISMTIVALSIPAIWCIQRGNVLSTVLTMASGVAIFALLGALDRWLLPLCAHHERMAVGTVVAVGAMCAIYLVMAFVFTGPGHISGAYGRFERIVNMEQGQYTLSGDWDEEVSSIQILWRDRTGALMNKWTVLYDGSPDSVAFDVPAEGSVMVALRGPEGAEIRSITLSNGTSLKLDYPLFPTFVTERLQDSLSGSFSTWARIQYMKDAVKLFLQNPMIGHGLGATENLYRSVQPFAYESKYVHCQILQVLCETGILGLTAFLSLVVSIGFLCIFAIHKQGDMSFAPMLFATWVLMNGHSLMEINFSVRAFQCFAYALLVVPILLYAQPLIDGDTAKIRKKSKTVSIILTVGYALYLAAFGGLLESARMTDRKAEQFQTSDVYEYLDFLRGCVRGNVFDNDFYQRNYVANAVQLNDRTYNGDMLKYVERLRASGTYENDSALARYYYLPRQEWDELFACSLEGIHQVRSSPDGWNYQMDFYREEVLPAMGADNAEAFVDGVLALGDALDAMNAEGRLETVQLNETNQAFLTQCRFIKEQSLSAEEGYLLLIK